MHFVLYATLETVLKGQNLNYVYRVNRPKKGGARVAGVLTTNVCPMSGENV